MELPSSMCWKPQLALATRRWSEKQRPGPPASACSQSPPPRLWRQEHAWSFSPLSRVAAFALSRQDQLLQGGGDPALELIWCPAAVSHQLAVHLDARDRPKNRRRILRIQFGPENALLHQAVDEHAHAPALGVEHLLAHRRQLRLPARREKLINVAMLLADVTANPGDELELTGWVRLRKHLLEAVGDIRFALEQEAELLGDGGFGAEGRVDGLRSHLGLGRDRFDRGAGETALGKKESRRLEDGVAGRLGAQASPRRLVPAPWLCGTRHDH